MAAKKKAANRSVSGRAGRGRVRGAVDAALTPAALNEQHGTPSTEDKPDIKMTPMQPAQVLPWLRKKVLTKHGFEADCWVLDQRAFYADGSHVIGVVRLFASTQALLDNRAAVDAITFRFGYDPKQGLPTAVSILKALTTGSADMHAYGAELGPVAFQDGQVLQLLVPEPPAVKPAPAPQAPAQEVVEAPAPAPETVN